MTSTVPKLEKAGGRTYSTLAMITCLVLDVSVNPVLEKQSLLQ